MSDSKLKSVFIVTQGDYSSYRIIAVFSNRKKAKAFSEQQNVVYDNSRVETWKVDFENE